MKSGPAPVEQDPVPRIPVNYASRFNAFGVGPGATYSDQMELAVAMIGDAQRTIGLARQR